MLPSKSNNKENCSPTSSNCVVWQGPNISCINLCTGDSVSDVVYKMAEEICVLKEEADITDVELTCLLTVCQNTPQPNQTLANVLQLLINKVCCLNEIVLGIDPGTPYEEPILNLPLCLQYEDDGQPVTQLIHSEYTKRLADFICEMDFIVSQHTSEINDLETRVDYIENWKITPNCSYHEAGIVAGTPTPILDLLDAFEEKTCTILTILGSASQLTNVITSVCPGLNSKTSLSQPPLQMQNIPNWTVTPTTVAQSLTNLWITVCDIRNFVQNCNCGPSTTTPCEEIDLTPITTEVTISDSSQLTVSVDYTSIVIPPGTIRCSGNAIVRINDGNGNLYTDSVNLITVSGVVDYILPNTFIPGSALTLTIEYCLIVSDVFCEDTVEFTPTLPCAELTSITVYLTDIS